MIAYKVVYKQLGTGALCSCIMVGRLRQVYAPNIAVKAKVGGFLAFESLELAQYWTSAHFQAGVYEIWKCDGQERLTLPMRRFHGTNDVELIKSLWAYKLDQNISGPSWPRGTIAYKYVTLLEKVA